MRYLNRFFSVFLFEKKYLIEFQPGWIGDVVRSHSFEFQSLP